MEQEMLDLVNRATYDAIVKMWAGNLPRLSPESMPDLYYPNGCPILPEGPQKDDL